MGFFKDFKEFIQKGNAIDMAVGIIVGSVMTGVVNSLVKDIIMPPIGILLGGIDFSNWFIVINKGLGEFVSDLGGGIVGGVPHYPTIAAAHAAGAVTINIGLFINALVSFLIVMFAVFLLVKVVNKLRGEKPAPTPTTYPCQYCKMLIEKSATKCPYCCSTVKAKK